MERSSPCSSTNSSTLSNGIMEQQEQSPRPSQQPKSSPITRIGQHDPPTVRSNHSATMTLSAERSSGSSASIIFDSASSASSSSDKREESKIKFSQHILTLTGSIMYAILIVVLTCLFYLLDVSRPSTSRTPTDSSSSPPNSPSTSNFHQSFNAVLCLIGLSWLLFFHWDIQRYKKRVMRSLFPHGVPSLPLLESYRNRGRRRPTFDESTFVDNMSMTNTEVIFNTVSNMRSYHIEGVKGSSKIRGVSNIHSMEMLPPSTVEERHQQQPTLSPRGGHSHPASHHHHRSASITSLPVPPLLSLLHQSYRFLHGRHSSSFYLKFGMSAFCFGHMIHEGLKAGHQVYYFASGDQGCQNIHQLVLHTIRPIFSFYQLFMLFKYSNIIINRCQALASFGLMHLIGTSIAFWIGSIMDDAMDFYVLHHVSFDPNGGGPQVVGSDSGSANSGFSNATEPSVEIESSTPNLQQIGQTTASIAPAMGDFITDSRSMSDMMCQASLSPSITSSKILPYMYPFSIEYNLCLATMWYLMWTNVGREDHHNSSQSDHFQGTVSTDETGREEVNYESNIVIRADCHASNKGLFGGIFVLLVNLVMMFMFFISLSNLPRVAFYVFTGQEVLLAILLLVTTMVGYWKTCRLDLDMTSISQSPSMDLILLMVPLPCFFISYVMSMTAEVMVSLPSSAWSPWNLWRVALLFLMLIQVILQTIFIVDSSHRCSQSKRTRFKKPGREMITFSILLNVTSWIVYTFETKAAESFYPEVSFYGETTWMIASHATLPLMLFYRFHASVCLADIWKFAYERPHLD